jgi:hypothetical protein
MFMLHLLTFFRCHLGKVMLPIFNILKTLGCLMHYAKSTIISDLKPEH